MQGEQGNAWATVRSGKPGKATITAWYVNATEKTASVSVQVEFTSQGLEDGGTIPCYNP